MWESILKSISADGAMTAITGSGGALVVLIMWVRHLQGLNKKKDDELREITKETIKCVTEVVERYERDQPWKEKLEEMIQETHRYIISEHNIKEVMDSYREEKEGDDGDNNS